MNNTIINKDILEGLNDLENDSIDVVFTSPPYFNLKTYEGGWTPWESFEDYLADNKKWLEKIMQKLKPGGFLFWQIQSTLPNVDKKNGLDNFPLSAHIQLMGKELGYLFHIDVSWNKNTSGQLMFGSYPKPVSPIFMLLDERILIFKKKGRRITEEKIEKDIWFDSIRTPVVMKPESAKRLNHPAPFPWRLAKHFIQVSCPKEGTVLDVFMGSGSTLFASNELGIKNSIGIEISKEYATEASKRLENQRNELNQKDLFDFTEEL